MCIIKDRYISIVDWFRLTTGFDKRVCCFIEDITSSQTKGTTKTQNPKDKSITWNTAAGLAYRACLHSRAFVIRDPICLSRASMSARWACIWSTYLPSQSEIQYEYQGPVCLSNESASEALIYPLYESCDVTLFYRTMLFKSQILHKLESSAYLNTLPPLIVSRVSRCMCRS